MNASLDIIICTYNRANYLERVLNAIAKQKISRNIDWGVLVVNNNSTDATAEVIEQHRQSGKIPNFKSIIETKQGLNYARQAGIVSTERTWFAFIDDDCLIAANWVEQTLEFADTHPQCGAFGGQVILEWEKQPKPFVKSFGYCFAEQNHGTKAKQVACLVGTGMTINRSALLTTGWLEKQYLQDRVGKKLISGGDVELALRLGAKYQLWYAPQCQLHHLIPPQRTTFSYLLKINYGLGVGQALADSLLWSDTKGNWLKQLFQPAQDFSMQVAKKSLKALLGKGSKANAILNLSFAWGRWIGIGRLILMNSEKRQQLLGCAKVIN